jgi:4-amino-4-deoxy-L-arabinose transferase-like glycosyltransferase
MSEVATVFRTLASATGVRHREGESPSAYLDRVADEVGLDDGDRDRLADLARQELFSADDTLSRRERRELTEICDRVARRDGAGRTGTTDPDRDRDDPPSTRREPDPALDGGPSTDPSADGVEYVTQVALDADGATTRASADEPTSGTRPDRGLRARLRSRSPVSRADVTYLLPLVAGAAFVFFYGLGSFPLQSWDEGFYGNLARHMVRDGYWVVPHMYYRIGLRPSGFEPWLRLPPLGMWIQAVSMLAFGVNAFAVRAPSAAASLLTVVLVYVVGRDVWSARTGFFAGAVYLTTPYVYAGFNAGRDGGLDTILVLFGSLFVYTTWLAVEREDPRWLYLTGLFGGLAVLTKGFGAGVFLLVVLPLVFFRQRTFLSTEMAGGAGITALLTVPWPAYVYSLYGDLFVQQFFVRYVFERAAGGAFGTNTNTLFAFMDYPYVKELLFAPNLFHPWSFLFLLALPVFVYREVRGGEGGSTLEAGLLVWWILVSFGLFVFIGNKVWYIMPMYVPAAVLLGRVIDEAVSGRQADLAAVAAGGVLVVALSPEYSVVPGPAGVLAKGTVLTLGVVSVAWSVPLRDRLETSLPSRLYAGLSRAAPLLVVLVMVAALVGTPPTGDGNVEQRALAETVDRHAPADATVFVERGLGTPFHTFSFYAGRPLESGSLPEFRRSDARYAILATESISRAGPGTTVLTNTTVASGRDVSLVVIDR